MATGAGTEGETGGGYLRVSEDGPKKQERSTLVKHRKWPFSTPQATDLLVSTPAHPSGTKRVLKNPEKSNKSKTRTNKERRYYG